MKLYHSITLIITANTEDKLEWGKQFFTRLFSEKFGGASVVEGYGGWVNAEGTLITEPHVQVTAFSNQLANSMYRDVRPTVWEFFTDAEQEAVAFIVDGQTMHVYDVDDLPNDLD